MRKVIQITDNGIFLCNDGTMWERKSKGYNGVYEWKQIDDVPQDKPMIADEFNDLVKCMFRESTRIRNLD